MPGPALGAHTLLFSAWGTLHAGAPPCTRACAGTSATASGRRASLTALRRSRCLQQLHALLTGLALYIRTVRASPFLPAWRSSPPQQPELSHSRQSCSHMRDLCARLAVQPCLSHARTLSDAVYFHAGVARVLREGAGCSARLRCRVPAAEGPQRARQPARVPPNGPGAPSGGGGPQRRPCAPALWCVLTGCCPDEHTAAQHGCCGAGLGCELHIPPDSPGNFLPSSAGGLLTC